jgi:hypothetical protein
MVVFSLTYERNSNQSQKKVGEKLYALRTYISNECVSRMPPEGHTVLAFGASVRAMCGAASSRSPLRAAVQAFQLKRTQII